MRNRYLEVCEIIKKHCPHPRVALREGIPYTNSRYDGRAHRDYRRSLVSRYSWAAPYPHSLEAVARFSPLVEMGSGSGYWAALLTDLGADVMCYDTYRFNGNGAYTFHHAYYPIRQTSPSVLKRVSPKRNLFLCWPPFNVPFAGRCLRHFRGEYVIYIGEGDGGCTGDDAFHEALGRDWTEVETFGVVRWQGLHDKGYIYRRK